jgi:hypothetical protein
MDLLLHHWQKSLAETFDTVLMMIFPNVLVQIYNDVLIRSIALCEAKLWRDINKNTNVFLYNFEYSGDAVRFQVPGFNPPRKPSLFLNI